MAKGLLAFGLLAFGFAAFMLTGMFIMIYDILKGTGHVG